MLGRMAALAAVGLLLGACAETQLLTHMGKKMGESDVPKGVRYKVGNPYQVEGIWYYPAEDYEYDEMGIASWYGPNFHGKLTANGEVYDQNDVTAAHKTLPMPCFVRVTNLDNGRSLVVRVNDRGPFVNGRIIDLSRRSAQLLGVIEKGTAKVQVQIMADESRAIAAALRNEAVAAGNGATPIQAAAMPKEAVSSVSLAPPPGATAAKASPDRVVDAKPAAPRPAAEEIRTASLSNPAGEKVSQMPAMNTQIYIQAGAFSQYDAAHKAAARLAGVGPVNVYPVLVNGRDLYRVRVGPLASTEAADRLLKPVYNAGFPDSKVIVDRPDSKTLNYR